MAGLKGSLQADQAATHQLGDKRAQQDRVGLLGKAALQGETTRAVQGRLGMMRALLVARLGMMRALLVARLGMMRAPLEDQQDMTPAQPADRRATAAR